MYLWNYHQLAKDFKAHKVTSREKFKYLLAVFIYVSTGLMGSNWIPGIYRFIYALGNKVLASQAPKVPPLKIYSDYNYQTDMAIIGIIIVGIVLCYLANKRGDGRFFIERFVCLSIPISIRTGVFVLFIFLATLGASLWYFYLKLQAIAHLHGFLKAFKQLRHLKRLMPVMAFISHRMHILSCVLAILSLLWNFFVLFKEIKFINKK